MAGEWEEHGISHPQAASARRHEAPRRLAERGAEGGAGPVSSAHFRAVVATKRSTAARADTRGLQKRLRCRRMLRCAGIVTQVARFLFFSSGAHALVYTRPLIAVRLADSGALCQHRCLCPSLPASRRQPFHLVCQRNRAACLALGMCEPPAQGGGSSSPAGSGNDSEKRISGGERATEPPSPFKPDGNQAFTGEWLAGLLKQNRYLKKWLEDELHEMETSVGYDIPGQGQIVEYDPAFLSKVGWMVNLRGTVFSIPFIYWQFLVMLLFALAYAWAAGPMPAVIDVMGMQGVACSSGGRLRLPILKPQTFALSLVGGLLGFLLSLFNTNGLDRWWKTRDCLGIVIGRSVDMARMLTTYLQGWDNESEKRAAWYREQLIRWLNLAHILVYRQANNQDDLEELVEDKSYTPARQWITREVSFDVLYRPPLVWQPSLLCLGV